MEKINLYIEAVHQLHNVLSPQLIDYTVKETQAVRLFTSLILCILHLLKCVCKEESEEASMRIKEYKDKLQKFVKEWVLKYRVVGGSMFGREIAYYDKVPTYTQRELKVIYMYIGIILC